MNLLNLGSGPHYAEGWTNVDLYAEHVDYRLDLFDIATTFGPVFDKVYVGHVLEHLPWERVPEAVDQIHRVLKPGGQVMVVGPCILLAAKTRQPDWLLEQILADPRETPTGLNHAWTPTAQLTLEAVRHCFDSAELVSVAHVTKPRWPNPDNSPWQCAVHAVRGG